MKKKKKNLTANWSVCPGVLPITKDVKTVLILEAYSWKSGIWALPRIFTRKKGKFTGWHNLNQVLFLVICPSERRKHCFPTRPTNSPLLISKPCCPLKFFFLENFEEVYSFLFRKHSDPSLGRTALNFAELSQPTLSILPWLNKTSTIPWNKYQCWATYEHKKDSWNNQEHTSRILGQRSSHDICTVCSVP